MSALESREKSRILWTCAPFVAAHPQLRLGSTEHKQPYKHTALNISKPWLLPPQSQPGGAQQQQGPGASRGQAVDEAASWHDALLPYGNVPGHARVQSHTGRELFQAGSMGSCSPTLGNSQWIPPVSISAPQISFALYHSAHYAALCTVPREAETARSPEQVLH